MKCPTVVFEKLHNDYEHVTIRTTHLEWFMQCAFKHKNQEDPHWNLHYFLRGKAVNTVIQPYLLKRKKLKDWTREWPSDFSMIKLYDPEYHKYLSSCLYLSKNLDYNIVANEVDMTVDIEMWSHLVTLTWTPDLIARDDDGKVTILDLKTTTPLRKDETVATKLQWKIYPFLYSQFNNTEVKWFEYCVFTSHKTPRLQRFYREYDNKKVSEELKTMLELYIFSLSSDKRWTTTGNHCFYCPLKTAGICPEFKPKLSNFED